MNNVPKIVGGGDYRRKKLRQKPKPKPGAKKMPRQPQPMPYYPSTGSNKKPGAMHKENLKNAIVKIWQDRNSSNQGTKLNP